MKTIIHDLKKIKVNKDDRVLNANKCINSCIGCFSCWIKHPKDCIYNDEYSTIVESLKNSDELIIISKSRYGSYSSEVKRVLERCIGYVLPYFTIRNNEIHHKERYNNRIKVKAYFYGNITSKERINLEKLVKANSVNINAKDYEVYFFKNKEELAKCIH